MKCTLCPRNCNVDRNINAGFCGESDKIRIARAALHFYEEPSISGAAGSGAVFFCGCNLKCVFCQNESISGSRFGMEVSIERLAEIFLELQSQSANNINLVTPSHFVPQIREALILAGNNGLSIPIVYNTSAYESVESLKLLEGLVDIYLPDMKYSINDLAVKYSKAPGYFEISKAAIQEMYRQVKAPVIDEATGLMKKGVIVRHLLLPLGVKNACGVVSWLHETFGENIYISLMNQYTPMTNSPSLLKVKDEYPHLCRKVTKREYERLIDFVLSLNIQNAYIQEGDTASDSFIPSFDYTGI